ncbi:MAG: sulfotransferase family 2 domain-containing protein [Chloroflexi bacterium]|nr:sulfotransferase family 2 domain-containing protein [Chloroflexota bacterium]
MPASTSEPSTVIFLHIPKTAGSTLHQIIRRQYRAQHIYHMGSRSDSFDQFKNLPLSRRADIRVLMGHFEMGIDEYLPQPSTYFTMLRDPIARAISYFSHVRRDSDHYCHNLVTTQHMNLETFINSQADVMIDNGQTRMLAGQLYDIPFGQCDKAVLEIAQRNLQEQFAFAGLTERFDEALLLMRYAFGWRNLYYTRRNIGPEQDKKPLPDATLSALEQVNQWDAALYAFAEKLFVEKMATLEPAFSRNLHTFQRWNSVWGVLTHYGDELRLRLLGPSER